MFSFILDQFRALPLQFYENRPQNKQITFDKKARLKIFYGDQFITSHGLTNSDPIEWEEQRFPVPNPNIVGTTFTVTGNDKKVTITINGVRDGDDQSVYTFETEDMNGVTNKDEYEFIVLRQPVQLDLESINPFAVEGNETPISKCIARGKWLDFLFYEN